MTEWREYRLSDIMDIISGGTPKTSVPEYWSGNIPWLSVADFNNVNRYVYDTEKHISELGLKNSSTKILKKGQLIISARGTVGALAQLKRDMAFNQSCYGLNANSLTTNDFLFYLLKYCIAELKQQSSGGVFDTIIRETFDNISVFLPPLPEQKAIAEVLSSLDDKIDLLTRQNKTLEDLAQAYFRKWFIEDASDEWEVGKLGDFVEVIDNRGKTPPYQDIPTEYPIIEVKSISGDNRFIDYQKCEKFVLESTYKTWFRGYIKPLDVLVSTVGSVGEIAQVLLEHGVIAQNVIGLRSKGTSPYHLFEYMKYMKNEIKELDIGSVQPSIKVPHLLSLQYVKPDRDSLRKFDDFSKELVNKMISNFMQIQTLQKLRDTLLPKLISGEIRVKM